MVEELIREQTHPWRMDWLDAERGHSADSVLTARPAASEQAGQSRVVVTVSINSWGK